MTLAGCSSQLKRLLVIDEIYWSTEFSLETVSDRTKRNQFSELSSMDVKCIVNLLLVFYPIIKKKKFREDSTGEGETSREAPEQLAW